MGSSLMSQEWFLNFTSNLNLILQKEKNKKIIISPITWLQRYSTTQTNVKNWDLIHSILPLCNNSYFLGFQVSIIILLTTPSRNYCQVSGLSKVAGCRRKLPPTWSVSAGYSAWHFFTDGVFLNKISLDWLTGWLNKISLWQLSRLFQKFWQPWVFRLMGIWALFVLTLQSNFIHRNFNMLLFNDTAHF